MIFTKAKEQAQMINVSEANNIWDILKSNYLGLELVKLWENYAHDKDFKIIVRAYMKDIEQDVSVLEQEIKKFGIRGPDKNRIAINSSVNTETLMDEYLAQEFLVFAQENIEQLLRAFRTSTDNDKVRGLIVKFAKQAIKRTDQIIGYLKIKGWLETPPLYLQIPAEVNEKLGAGEAFHLWDHLTFRYDNISQSEIYHAFAKDLEFKALLQTGLQSSLKKQAQLLERELTYFGIPLPKRPKDFNMTADNTELLDDDHMFRMVLMGIQGAAIFHAQALKQSTVNERVRGIFKELLFAEIGYNDNLIKFGKLKGWLNPVPQHQVQ
jgi:hypothetical protein